MRIDEKILNEYLNYIKLNLKITTYRKNSLKFKKYIFAYFKGYLIKDLNVRNVCSWKMYINTFDFKYNYKANLFYILTSFFDFLEKFYNLPKNYARIEKNFHNDNNNIVGSYWTIDEFNRFIKQVDDKKLNILFRLLYFSGMRKGEVLALKWSDVDFTNKKIIINKNITKKRELISPKTSTSNRIISINESIVNDLFKIKSNIDEFIFDISFTTLTRKKDYYCDLANVKRIKIHEFRHSHAIYLYTNDIPLDEISRRLGHSKISITTDTYLRYLPRDENKVIELLNSTNL